MKRITLLIISILILSCPAFSAHAAGSVSFSLDSVETDVNRITEIGVNCSDTSDLGAAVFDFDYDKTALEFKGTESGGTVRYCDGEKLRVVYYCGDNSASASEIFKLKFKTVKDGSYSVNYDVSECSAKSGDNLSVGSVVSGAVVSSGNGKADSKNFSSESGVASGGKSTAKSKSLGAVNDDYGDLFDDSDDVPLTQKGGFNGVEDNPYFPYFILLIIVAALVLIAVVTLLTVRVIIKKKKSAADKSQNTQANVKSKN